MKLKNTYLMKFILTKAKFVTVLIIFGIIALIQTAEASVASYTKDKDGITFTLDKGLMKVKICKDDIIEVKYTLLNAFPQKSSLVIKNSWADPALFNTTESNNEVIISTRRLKIKVNKLTNSISYTTLTGAVILAEDESAGKR